MVWINCISTSVIKKPLNWGKNVQKWTKNSVWKNYKYSPPYVGFFSSLVIDTCCDPEINNSCCQLIINNSCCQLIIYKLYSGEINLLCTWWNICLGRLYSLMRLCSTSFWDVAPRKLHVLWIRKLILHHRPFFTCLCYVSPLTQPYFAACQLTWHNKINILASMQVLCVTVFHATFNICAPICVVVLLLCFQSFGFNKSLAHISRAAIMLRVWWCLSPYAQIEVWLSLCP